MLAYKSKLVFVKLLIRWYMWCPPRVNNIDSITHDMVTRFTNIQGLAKQNKLRAQIKRGSKFICDGFLTINKGR